MWDTEQGYEDRVQFYCTGNAMLQEDFHVSFKITTNVTGHFLFSMELHPSSRDLATRPSLNFVCCE